MANALMEVQEGLTEAFGHSKRKGKWSTVGEVKRYEDKASLIRLRKLVKQGSAVEKKINKVPAKLFKPTGGAGGGTGMVSLGQPGYRSPDPYDSPRGTPDVFTFNPSDGEGRPTNGDGRKTPENNWGKPPTGGILKSRETPEQTHSRRKGRQSRSKSDVARKTGQQVRSTIGTGIAAMLVGGMGSAAGASAGAAGRPTPTFSMPT